MLVDRGLLTPEELEDVLRAQQQSGRPLGQIIVDRGLISGPTLALTLAEQCGVELETDTGFGTGLWTAIHSRHKAENRRRGDLRVVPAPNEAVSEAPPAVKQDETLKPSAAAEEPSPQVAVLQDAVGTDRQELERLSRELADRDARLREMTALSSAVEAAGVQLAEANARVVELETALQERQRRVEALEAEEHTRAQELERLANQLEKRPAGKESGGEIESQQKEITRRADEVRERELGLKARAAELAERECELDVRVQHVETTSVEIAERARELAEREQAIAGRQRAILAAAADLERRRRELEERDRAYAHVDVAHEEQSDELRRVAERAWSLRLPHEVVPASTEVRDSAERHTPSAPERSSPAEGYRWNIETLSRLVEESADEFPDRVDDWRYTLFYLRGEARIDGAVPRNFDSLVEDYFGELLASRDRSPLPASGAVSPGRSA
jgi:hypothetical protein